MAGPGTTWSGPLISGPKKDADQNGPANTGLALLTQVVTLTHNGTTAVTGTFTLPQASQIVDFHIDTTTVWNSGTSDSLTIGTAAAGTQYVSGTDVTAAGRAAITYTAAQLAAMANVGTNTTVYATVTPAGTAATTGSTTVTILYIQTVQLTAGTA
jgi:hypothetical protein